MKTANIKQLGFGVVEVLILIAVLAILGLIGFNIYDKSKNQQAEKNEQNKTTSTSPPISSRSDWRSYTSKKEGLTISYPQTWTYKSLKTDDVFDKFTLTGPEGFVITCTIATIPLDGGEIGRKVEFVDEIKGANYHKPLYVVGHFSPEYNNLDTISVTDVKFTTGELNVGPRGFFKSKISEKMSEIGDNFVYLEGAFPLYTTSEGYSASVKHKVFGSGDLKVARQILNTVKYE